MQLRNVIFNIIDTGTTEYTPEIDIDHFAFKVINEILAIFIFESERRCGRVLTFDGRNYFTGFLYP
jgi:hypothetical protein